MVHYVDNESMRLALLKGSGETPTARKVADEIMNAEYALQTKSLVRKSCQHQQHCGRT